MRFKADRKQFLSAISAVKSATGKPLHPILECLVIAVTAVVKITASDGNIWLTHVLEPLEIGSGGTAAVNAATLVDVVKSLSGESLDVVKDGNSLVVSCGKARVKVDAVIDPASMPAQPVPVQSPAASLGVYTVSSDILAEILTAALPAASRDPNRPHLTGVHLSFLDDSGFTAEACNGYMATLIATKGHAGKAVSKGTIPAKACQIIAQLDGPVELIRSGQFIFAITDTVSIAATLLEGQFPPVDTLVPKVLPSKYSSDKAGLLQAVRLAGIFSRGGGIELHCLKDAVSFEASNEKGKCKQEVQADLEGQVVTVKAAPEYLQAAFNACPGDSVELGIASDLGPVIVSGSGEFYSVTSIIAGMRL